MKKSELHCCAAFCLCPLLKCLWLKKIGKAAKAVGDMQLLNHGIPYTTAEGAQADYGKALEIFRQADEDGNKKTGRYLCMMYEQGLDVARDYAGAAEY